jgi:hypothetical protein
MSPFRGHRGTRVARTLTRNVSCPPRSFGLPVGHITEPAVVLDFFGAQSGKFLAQRLASMLDAADRLQPAHFALVD